MAVAHGASGAAGGADGADWRFGVGTGMQFLNASGDLGFTSFRGAEYVELDMDPSDFQDVMESALGISGFAERGRWRFAFTYGHLRLEDESTMALAGGTLPLDTFFRQDVNFVEMAATWQFAETAGHRWSALVGARNLRHQYDVRLSALEQASTRKLDHDWTDALVGMTHAYRLSDSIVWRNVATVGFGESESYWSWRTALHWQVARSWNLGFYVDYRAIDYEGDDPGDADWYLYDADEWGPGLTVDYTFD